MKTIAVAGHVCLDIIPEIPEINPVQWFDPGKLLSIGAANISAGGVVSNVGLILDKLGIPVRLFGKTGKDIIGKMILDQYQSIDASLAESMVISPDVSSSYTIVINPGKYDRCFWHHTGANDTFQSDDVPDDYLEDVRIFHFGYPPLMQRMIEKDGEELRRLFAKIKKRGIITSLDMAYPDSHSFAATVNWQRILKKVLPYVDIFIPSLSEIQVMLGIEETEPSVTMLETVSGKLMGYGSSVVGLKLGDKGLFLQTSDNMSTFNGIISDASAWERREIYSPCYTVNAVGTTGAGDATIAGFLAAMVKNSRPEDAVNSAAAVGAFSVEATDATSGTADWETVCKRIGSGWKKHNQRILPDNWHWNPDLGLAFGPRDSHY